MPKIIVEKGSILKFAGDAIICFSDSELSYRRGNPLLQVLDNISAGGGYRKTINKKLSNSGKDGKKELIRELSAVGYIPLGNAIITKSYDILLVNHILFIPHTDHSNDLRISSVELHKAIRAAFTLAELYTLQSVAIPVLKTNAGRKELFDKFKDLVLENRHKKTLDEQEFVDIVVGISAEFRDVKEIFIYR